MHITLSEKIRLVRWRLKLLQYQFYDNICYMSEARYIENKDKYENIDQHLKSKNTLWSEHRYSESYNRTIEKLDAKYDLNPKDLTIGEKARILRLRAGDTLEDAGKKLCRSSIWVSGAENCIFYKRKRTSQNNAQELCDLYTTKK